MRAVRVVDGRPAVVDVTLADPGDGWEALDVVATGICGSDLHLLDLGVTVTLGHEIAARRADGALVAVAPVQPCGGCARCADGQAEVCQAMIGPLGVAVDGGLAEQVVAPTAAIVPLPSPMVGAEACLVEPVAVAVHAVNRLDPVAGVRVLVIGGGTIGLAAVVAAQRAGATVDVSARHRHQMVAADRLGAGVTPGTDYDVVIEAAGTESALAEAIDRARPGGRVGVPAVYWSAVRLENPQAWLLKQIDLVPATLYGHHHGVRETEVAAALLSARPDLAEVLVTHRFGLDDAGQAFSTAADRAGGAIKVVLEPG